MGAASRTTRSTGSRRCSRSSARSWARRRSSGRCARPATSSCAPGATPARDWGSLPASVRAKVIARAMLEQHGRGRGRRGRREDRAVVPVRQRRPADRRRPLRGRPLRISTLREQSGRTFMRDELPVYCAHCSVNNEMQPVEWGGDPDEHRAPARAQGRAVRPPRLQGRVGDSGRRVRPDRQDAPFVRVMTVQ